MIVVLPRLLVLSSLIVRSHQLVPLRSTVRVSSSSKSSIWMSHSSKVQDTLEPCVILMKKMIAEYEQTWVDRGGIYSLAQGVVYWDPPASVTTALQDALTTNTLHQYGPDEGLVELRVALEAKLEAENSLSDHHVMITAGANQAYMNCILTLLGNGEQAVFFRPYYFNHIMATQLAVGKDGVVLGECSDQGVPDLDWLELELASNSLIKIVTLTNPGNPTGVNLDQDVLKRAVELCKQNGKWLILDCTYEHFQHNHQDQAMQFPCFEDPHVIHIFSFSKGYALAGYRCGYVVLSKQANDTYQQMRKVQDTIPICPSRFSQYAALGALSAGRDWVMEKVQTLKVGRDAILEALSPLDQVMGGSGAMYVMGKLPSHNCNDEDVARSLVRDYGVAVIPGTFCGFPGWIRVCYSNLRPDVCTLAADRLSQGLKVLCKK